MEDILYEIGLNDKETAIYLSLLKNPWQTAQQLSTKTDIKRTNAYRILDDLLEKELVKHDKSPVRKFCATEPQALQRLLQQSQQNLKKTSQALSQVMPSFRSQYALSLNKPGVVHSAGTDGLEQLLIDMATSQTEVLLVAGDDYPTDETVLARFQDLIMQRKKCGVATRALFHDGPDSDFFRDKFQERGFDVRFLGNIPFKSEIALYENNVAFTVYDPSIITTIVTNQHIAETMRTLFEELWGVARV